MGRQLWESSSGLAPLQPNFVSVTYGADGSTRTRTHDCVLRILRETNLTVAPHLTCVGASRAEVLRIARDYWQQGVRNLVALRGDAPAAQLSPDGRYRPYAGGFAYASDLVEGLAGVGKFDLSVAAYPEGHPESGSVDADLENLKRRWTPVPAVQSPSFSSSGRIFCGIAIDVPPRDSRAARTGHFADYPFSTAAALLPIVAVRPCRHGCASASMDWMTIRRRGG